MNFPDHGRISGANVVAIHLGELAADSPGISDVVAVGFNFKYHGFNLATSQAFFLTFCQLHLA